MMFTKLHLLVITTMLLLTPVVAEEENSFFDSHFNDYEENISDAVDAGKDGIFIFFHMEECPFCQKMKRTVLNQKPVIEYFKKHFLNFEVDVESELNLVDFNGTEIKEKIFAKRHNLVGATPVLAFFDLTGKRVVRRTGFASKKEFMLLAKYTIDKEYEKENFVRYKRKNR